MSKCIIREMIKWIVIVLCISHAAMSAELRLLSTYSWTSENPAFGGFSSLYVSEKGSQFLTTSDRGYFLSGRIKRQDGKIVGVEQQELLGIRDTKGEPIKGFHVDSEGLAIGTDGRIYVSFEGKHRVWAYSNKLSEAAWLPEHPDFKTMQNNSSLEALAIDRRGWLYTIPERSGVIDRPFPVYRFTGTVWDKKFKVPRRAPFLVAGADFGPDNKLYLLERDFKFPTGFATRIRRFTLTDTGFKNEETLIETTLGFHDNLEGISVWRDAQNRIRITLISDDNFKFFQRTELVEYVID